MCIAPKDARRVYTLLFSYDLLGKTHGVRRWTTRKICFGLSLTHLSSRARVSKKKNQKLVFAFWIRAEIAPLYCMIIGRRKPKRLQKNDLYRDSSVRKMLTG